MMRTVQTEIQCKICILCSILGPLQNENKGKENNVGKWRKRHAIKGENKKIANNFDF